MVARILIAFVLGPFCSSKQRAIPQNLEHELHLHPLFYFKYKFYIHFLVLQHFHLCKLMFQALEVIEEISNTLGLSYSQLPRYKGEIKYGSEDELEWHKWRNSSWVTSLTKTCWTLMALCWYRMYSVIYIISKLQLHMQIKQSVAEEY